MAVTGMRRSSFGGIAGVESAGAVGGTVLPRFGPAAGGLLLIPLTGKINNAGATVLDQVTVPLDVRIIAAHVDSGSGIQTGTGHLEMNAVALVAATAGSVGVGKMIHNEGASITASDVAWTSTAAVQAARGPTPGTVPYISNSGQNLTAVGDSGSSNALTRAYVVFVAAKAHHYAADNTPPAVSGGVDPLYQSSKD